MYHEEWAAIDLQASLAQQPDWWPDSKFRSLRYSKREIRETGL